MTSLLALFICYSLGTEVAPFESYNGVTSELYQNIKTKCLEEGEEAWELQKQQWKDALIRVGDDDVLPPDALQAEALVYFDKVLKQQEDLVRYRMLPF